MFQESSIADILLTSRRIFEIGDTHETLSIVAVKRHGSPPLLLTLSDAELRKVEECD